MQAEAFGSALAAQGKQIRASTTAVAASAVVAPLQSFLETSAPDLTKNRYFKKGLPLAPLLLLRPPKRGDGLQALVADPRVWAVAAVAGLVIAEEIRGGSPVQDVHILSVPVSTATPGTFFADAVDGKGRIVPGKTPDWKSENDQVATVDANGEVTGVGRGTTVISATVDGIVRRVAVKVT
jgi:hypothetical protein